MNIPAEIVNNAPALWEHGSQWVLSHLQGEVGDFIWKQFTKAITRRVAPSIADADPAELAKRLSRAEDAIDGMQDELQVLAMRFPDHQVAREMLEPAAQDFVSDAFLAVMESPSPEKRTLLGRLIAQRLYAKTESSNELYLRQAEMLTRRMNTSHLWVAATVYLVHNAPLPQGYKRDDVYGWMDRNLWPVFSVVCKNVPTYDELDYLSSLGVVTYDRSDRSDNLSLSSHAPSLEQRLLHASNEHFEQFAVVRRGRFYDRAVELDEGKFSKEHGQELISLAPYALTVPGLRIAETMVTQIHEELVAPTVFDGGLPSFEVVVYGLG